MQLIDLDNHFVQPLAILSIKPSRDWQRVEPQGPDDFYDEEGFGWVPFITVSLLGGEQVMIKFDNEAARDERLAQIVAEMRAA